MTHFNLYVPYFGLEQSFHKFQFSQDKLKPIQDFQTKVMQSKCLLFVSSTSYINLLYMTFRLATKTLYDCYILKFNSQALYEEEMDTTTSTTTEWFMEGNFTDLFSWKKRSISFTEQYIMSTGLDNNIDLNVRLFCELGLINIFYIWI